MMKWIVGLLGLLVCAPAWATPAWATPYTTSVEVQRITPARCPVDIIPSVNSQGVSGAPKAVTTNAKLIPGKPNRVVYTFISDGDFCAEYGTSTDTAATTAPVGANPCTAGALYKASTLYIENVYPANRMDAACVSGTCNISTVECNP